MVYTITPSGTSTPLFTDPDEYFSDPLGISRDPVSGSYFLVDDEVDSLNIFSSNGSTVNQISGSVGTPSAVVVADTVAGGPLTFSPAPGTLTAGYTGVPYSLPLAASGGSGNYSWQVVHQSTGLNLLPPACADRRKHFIYGNTEECRYRRGPYDYGAIDGYCNASGSTADLYNPGQLFRALDRCRNV